MSAVDDVMLSPDLFEPGNLLEAPSGSLFWEFEATYTYGVTGRLAKISRRPQSLFFSIPWRFGA
jgi:hypothetical protein